MTTNKSNKWSDYGIEIKLESGISLCGERCIRLKLNFENGKSFFYESKIEKESSCMPHSSLKIHSMDTYHLLTCIFLNVNENVLGYFWAIRNEKG